MLKKLTGPKCIKCGCRDAQSLGAVEYFGREYERRQCRHCAAVYRVSVRVEADAGETVTYHATRCPSCNSARTRVRSTQRPVRHHKCEACGHCFKSVERD